MKAQIPLTALLLLLTQVSASAEENKIDPATGLVVAPGYETVKANCTACHSARLVTQNRADRQGWVEMIRWMQETQNLWQFDTATEKTILDYLATHYAPTEQGRRAPIKVERWYRLDSDKASVN